MAHAQRSVLQHAAVELQRVVDQPVQVGRDRARAAQPRELRELVDQPLQRFDLGDDRARALVDQRARVGRRVREVPAEPLGAELDRRQRILDLVRQPPRDVAPRRDALRANERRHVVEHEDRAFRPAVVAGEQRRRRGQVNLAVVARQRDFLHDAPATRRRGRLRPAGSKRLQIRRGRTSPCAGRPMRGRVQPEQPAGGAVERLDASLRRRAR